MKIFKAEYDRTFAGKSYNQVDLEQGYEYHSLGSVYLLNNSNYKEYSLRLQPLVIPSTFKTSHFLSQVFFKKGFILSDSARKIMSSNAVPPHRFFPVDFASKVVQEPYYLLYLEFDLLNHIDYPNSDFYTVNGLAEKSATKLQSKLEYEQLLKKLHDGSEGFPAIKSQKEIIAERRNQITMVGYNALSIDDSLPEKYDIFYDHKGFYVSNKLRDELQKLNNLGLTFSVPKLIK